jgi:broad specificity phosphatase PhoE
MLTGTQAVTTVDLLRHGRTTADDIFRGQVDTPLSAEGYRQMQASLASYSAAPPWQQIVTSPLQRCRHFAGELAASHSLPLHEDRGFIEMDFGDWDGRSFAEVRAADPQLFEQLWQRPDLHTPPNGESFAGFCARIHRAWQTLLATHSGQHILLVCHGGVIRALLGHVMQAPLTSLSRIEVPYASFSRIKIYHHPDAEDWPQLVSHGPGH